MEAFGQFISQKVQDGKFRVDSWDVTQVFPSPENTKEENDSYVISTSEFFTAVASASRFSKNIKKRAKQITSARCLIVDESGRVYIGGEDNLEIGNLTSRDFESIGKQIEDYGLKEQLSEQRSYKYLEYSPGN